MCIISISNYKKQDPVRSKVKSSKVYVHNAIILSQFCYNSSTEAMDINTVVKITEYIFIYQCSFIDILPKLN